MIRKFTGRRIHASILLVTLLVLMLVVSACSNNEIVAKEKGRNKGNTIPRKNARCI